MNLEDEIKKDNDNTALMLVDSLDECISDARATWNTYIMTMRRSDLKRFKKLQITITNLCNQLLTHQHYYTKHKEEILDIRDEFNDPMWMAYESESHDD